VSLEAVRWAFDQPVEKSSAKFVLVAMADCVNAEAAEMLCWPSYRFLAQRTGQDFKTVEAGIYRLRQAGYISDTGQRKGDTGKVVVYRLNTPENGVVKQETDQVNGASGDTGNAPENGAIGTNGNDPEFLSNPPKNGEQSPQKRRAIPPKTGSGIRKKQEGTSKESGIDAACAALPEVPRNLMADWLKVRKDKRAGPVTETVASGLRREAAKVGLSPEQAVRFSCEAGWQGFNAEHYLTRIGRNKQTRTDKQSETVRALTGGLANPGGNHAALTYDVD
jgi:hypothetical protein